MKKKAVIYGVRSGDTYHYIGKTVQLNMDGEVVNSNVARQYTNSEIRNVFVNNEVVIDELSSCNEGEWYDDKLKEVVQKHGEQHPLLNAQWMLDGKRGVWEGTDGYWIGKTRDANTLRKLSESKYKKVCQYSVEGVLLEVWDGGKEAAIKVFGDYSLDNTHGKSGLYKALYARTMNGRFRVGCYWFRHEDLMKYFNGIPNKLNITLMYAEEKRLRSLRMKENHNQTHTPRYTVIQYNKAGDVINRFDNTSHAAFELKLNASLVQKLCSGRRENSNYNLKYGERVSQEINLDYGKYKINCKKHVKPRKIEMISKTTTPVLHFKGDMLLRTYEGGVREAVKRLGFSEYKVRKLCRTRQVVNNRRLEFGEKKTVLTPRFGIKSPK